MDDQTMMMLLAGFAGLLCLASVALLVGVFVAWSRRQSEVAAPRRPTSAPPPRPAAPRVPAPTPSAPAPRPVAPAPRAPSPAKTEPPAGAGLPGPDYTEDELPTVVVASPTRPPAGAPPAPSTPASRRSAGATIIAFDEDDEGDDE